MRRFAGCARLTCVLSTVFSAAGFGLFGYIYLNPFWSVAANVVRGEQKKQVCREKS